MISNTMEKNLHIIITREELTQQQIYYGIIKVVNNPVITSNHIQNVGEKKMRCMRQVEWNSLGINCTIVIMSAQ